MTLTLPIHSSSDFLHARLGEKRVLIWFWERKSTWMFFYSSTSTKELVDLVRETVYEATKAENEVSEWSLISIPSFPHHRKWRVDWCSLLVIWLRCSFFSRNPIRLPSPVCHRWLVRRRGIIMRRSYVKCCWGIDSATVIWKSTHLFSNLPQ